MRTTSTKLLLNRLLDAQGRKYLAGTAKTKEGVKGYLLFNSIVIDKNAVRLYLDNEEVAYINHISFPNFNKGASYTFVLDEGLMRIYLK